MAETQIRWEKRFSHFQNAFTSFDEAVELANMRPLSRLEQQGVIQAFEYTHELAWKVMKDFLEEQGISGIIGSKGATREAFKQGLIENGDIWMEMIESRNLTSHIYNLETAEAIVAAILKNYHHVFLNLKNKLAAFLGKS